MISLRTARATARALLLAACALVASIAAVARAADASIHSTYMHKSGLWKQLEDLGPGIQASLAQVPQLTPAQVTQLSARVKRAYGADRLRAAVEKQLAATLPAADAQTMVQWYDSDVGMRVVRAEEAAGAPDAAAARQARAAQALAELAPERKVRVERLLKASGGVETVATVMMNQALGIARGIASYSGRADIDPTPALKAELEMSRAQLAGSLLPRLIADFAMIYSDISDADIDRYVSVLESEAGRSATLRTNAALENALNDAAVELGRGIGEDASPSTPRTTT